MTVNYRALLTWIILLVFLILLVLRLDDKVTWNWFIIFIPLWLFDVIIVIYIVFFMIKHCTSGVDQGNYTMLRKSWCLGCVALKVLFQVLICLRLQYIRTMGTFIILIPMWVLLLALVGDISANLLRRLSVTPSCTCSPICKSD